MRFNLDNMKVHGIHTVFPDQIINFEDEIDNYSFSAAQSRKLKNVMGFDKRRVVRNQTTSADLAISGFEYLSRTGVLSLDTIDALIVVTQTPDYLMPGTSYIIHRGASFRDDIVTLDLNQGCAGFITGLIAASSLMHQQNIQRVALVNVDVLSRLVSAHDRNSRPIVGDAAAITILDQVEVSSAQNKNVCQYHIDSAGWHALQIPAGGMKARPNSETQRLVEDSKGNLRAANDLVMDGEAVFDFVMKRVPELINDICELANIDKNVIDKFVFHQPNKFMLKKLADKLGVEYEKVPMNLVEEYGNSSGASIPAVLCTEFSKEYFDCPRTICVAGFGVGLTWGGSLLSLHEIDFLSVSNYQD